MTELSSRSHVHPVVAPEPLFRPMRFAFRACRRRPGGTEAYFFWARNAIFHGLRALGIRPGETILVPAYLCTAAIAPLEHFGTKVEFYAIRRNCEPDWQDLEAKIGCETRAVLAVHYFGFPCDMEKFSALRERYGVFLIEDCAHVLMGLPNQPRFGGCGDFSVFSPRKYLPIFDGGILRLNRAAPGFRVRFLPEGPLFTLRVAKDLIERRRPPAMIAVRSALPVHSEGVRTERDSQVAPSRAENPRKVLPNSTSFLPWMADFPMSRLSKYVLRHAPLENIGSRRRANYCGLLERIGTMDRVQPLFDRLAPDVVPWMLPLTIGARLGAHTALRALGIPAVTWGDVRDRRITAHEFPDADFLYEHLIFLPVHQDLEPAHLDRMADAIARVAAG